MAFYRVFKTVTGGSHLINFKYVSDVCLYKRNIFITLANQKESISGSLVWFSGGESKKIKLTHDTEQEAINEFNNIKSIFDKS
jgi:hypothetical protein